MDTLARLNNLVGRRGLLKLKYAGEVGFTFLSVAAAAPTDTDQDDAAFHQTITQSEFGVRFDEGIVVDGSNTRVVSGRYISSISGPY
jgi:hypothetical protein